jgi:hypothetical protein
MIFIGNAKHCGAQVFIWVEAMIEGTYSQGWVGPPHVQLCKISFVILNLIRGLLSYQF